MYQSDPLDAARSFAVVIAEKLRGVVYLPYDHTQPPHRAHGARFVPFDGADTALHTVVRGYGSHVAALIALAGAVGEKRAARGLTIEGKPVRKDKAA